MESMSVKVSVISGSWSSSTWLVRTGSQIGSSPMVPWTCKLWKYQQSKLAICQVLCWITLAASVQCNEAFQPLCFWWMLECEMAWCTLSSDSNESVPSADAMAVICDNHILILVYFCFCTLSNIPFQVLSSDFSHLYPTHNRVTK